MQATKYVTFRILTFAGTYPVSGYPDDQKPENCLNFPYNYSTDQRHKF